MDGIAHNSNPPIEWSETNNVKWKVAVPGHGSSTPIIWGELLYVLTAIPTDGSTPPLAPHTNPDAAQGRGRRRGHRAGPAAPADVEQEFKLLAMKRSDGSVVWERTGRKPSRMTANNKTIATRHRRRQRTARSSSPISDPGGSTATTWRAICNGARTSATCTRAAVSAKAQPRRFTVTPSSFNGTTNGSRSSPRSTRTPAKSDGEPIAMKSRRGVHPSSSSTTAAYRSLQRALKTSPATISRPATSCGTAPASRRILSLRPSNATESSTRRVVSAAALPSPFVWPMPKETSPAPPQLCGSSSATRRTCRRRFCTRTSSIS